MDFSKLIEFSIYFNLPKSAEANVYDTSLSVVILDIKLSSKFIASISFLANIVKVDKALPSENDVVKNGTPVTRSTIKLVMYRMIETNVTDPIKITNHFKETATLIPIVIAQKYTDSSNGDLTGFLKRTIERAPTIPSESAILPDITLVMT